MQGKARFSSGWFFTNSQNRLSLCHYDPSRQISSLFAQYAAVRICHKFLKRTNISRICFFVSFGVQVKKLEKKIAVSLFRCFAVSWFSNVLMKVLWSNTVNAIPRCHYFMLFRGTQDFAMEILFLFNHFVNRDLWVSGSERSEKENLSTGLNPRALTNKVSNIFLIFTL